MKCPLCSAEMVVRRHNAPLTTEVTGGTVSLPTNRYLEGSIWLNYIDRPSYYWECPKCKYVIPYKT